MLGANTIGTLALVVLAGQIAVTVYGINVLLSRRKVRYMRRQPYGLNIPIGKEPASVLVLTYFVTISALVFLMGAWGGTSLMTGGRFAELVIYALVAALVGGITTSLHGQPWIGFLSLTFTLGFIEGILLLASVELHTAPHITVGYGVWL